MIMNLPKTRNFRISPTAPYEFMRTFEKETKCGADWFWLSPFEIRTRDTIWSGLYLRGEPYGLRIHANKHRGSSWLSITVFTRHSLTFPQRSAVRRLLVYALDTNTAIAEFYRICNRYPYLAQARDDLWGMHELPFANLFHAILFVIALQRTSRGGTLRMLRNLGEHLGEQVSFDHQTIRLLPTPAIIAQATKRQLLACGLGYRAAFVRHNAQVIRSRPLELMELSHEPLDKAILTLAGFKGLGEYSMDVILPHPSFPVDSWNAGIFRKLFRLSATAAPAQIQEFASRHFGVWQKYVHSYILNDMEKILSMRRYRG